MVKKASEFVAERFQRGGDNVKADGIYQGRCLVFVPYASRRALMRALSRAEAVRAQETKTQQEKPHAAGILCRRAALTSTQMAQTQCLRDIK